MLTKAFLPILPSKFHEQAMEAYASATPLDDVAASNEEQGMMGSDDVVDAPADHVPHAGKEEEHETKLPASGNQQTVAEAKPFVCFQARVKQIKEVEKKLLEYIGEAEKLLYGTEKTGSLEERLSNLKNKV